MIKGLTSFQSITGQQKIRDSLFREGTMFFQPGMTQTGGLGLLQVDYSLGKVHQGPTKIGTNLPILLVNLG